MKQWLSLFLFIQSWPLCAMLYTLKTQKEAINAIFYNDTKHFNHLCQSQEHKQTIKTYRTRNNESLLHLAASQGIVPIIEKLIAIGLNPQEKNKNGDTPYVFARKCFKIKTATHFKKITNETSISINLLEDNAYYETLILQSIIRIRSEITQIKKLLTMLQEPIALDQK